MTDFGDPSDRSHPSRFPRASRHWENAPRRPQEVRPPVGGLGGQAGPEDGPTARTGGGMGRLGG